MSNIAESVERPELDYHRITIRVPVEQHKDPIISEMISRFELQVNIFAAQLSGSGEGDGWFDLGISGDKEKLKLGLDFLQEQKVEIWDRYGDSSVKPGEWDL
ncbi:MAG: ABC transporter [Synechococcaceae cyanobacterium SM2_3_1]|nr:ABC transporter [Synechococcaceae cyanobacterium SM2_3_1]